MKDSHIGHKKEPRWGLILGITIKIEARTQGVISTGKLIKEGTSQKWISFILVTISWTGSFTLCQEHGWSWAAPYMFEMQTYTRAPSSAYICGRTKYGVTGGGEWAGRPGSLLTTESQK